MKDWTNLPKPIKILAPMEDVTDVVFRQVVAEIGRPDIFFTEFTNAAGMYSPGRDRVTQRLERSEHDHILVAQIWGKTPGNHYKAAKELVERGFDGVDINMGCPVKKIVKQGSCSALIENHSLAKEIIEATIEGAGGNIPVSVKTRIGFSDKRTEEWAEFLLGFDLDAITVHGRISKQMSKYPADWNEIKKFVDLRDQSGSKSIIIGNGDVESLGEIYQKTEEFGVDGVMIGRGIFKDPFLFNPKKSIDDLSKKGKINLMMRHAELFVKKWGDTKNFSILKRFFKIYINGFDGASELRAKLMECENLEDLRGLKNSFG